MHGPQAQSMREDIENDEKIPLRYYQEHLTKIITNRTQVNSGVVRPAFKALKTSRDVLVQSLLGCTLQSFNSEVADTDLIAKILLLNKDLHYEVLYAVPAANPTIITGPGTSAQTAAAVSAYRPPFHPNRSRECRATRQQISSPLQLNQNLTQKQCIW